MAQRLIKLDEHVGKVDFNQWFARDPDCLCLLFLSDRERYVILSHLYPYGEWPTRLVTADAGNWYWTVEDADFQEYLTEYQDLIVKLTGGDAMGCNQALADALNNIALALRAGATGGGGGGCGSGPSSVLNCLSGYTDDQITDAPAADVDPGGSQPPDGFDTMEQYLAYKCQVANAIVDDVEHVFRTFQGLNGAAATMAVVTPVVIAALVGTGAVLFPPADVVALAVVVMSILTASIYGFSIADTIADYIHDHREAIVCSLYLSGGTTEAIGAITDLLEDAIQAVEWTTVFGEVLGPVLAGLYGTLAAKMENNGLVNSLFTLTLNFAYPLADCSGCGQAAGCWHFDSQVLPWIAEDASDEGCSSETNWVDDEEGADPSDTSPGRVRQSLTSNGGAYARADLTFTYGAEAGPVVHTGDEVSFEFCQLGPSQNTEFWLNFTDDTYAWSNYLHNIDLAWHGYTFVIGSGEDGKRIKSLVARTSMFFNGSEECDIDHICVLAG